MKKFIINILVILIFVPLILKAQENQVVFDGKTREIVQNTNVSIIPPAGYKYLGKQPAFIKNDNMIILQVNEMKDSIFNSIKVDRYIENEIKKKDLSLVSKREVELANNKTGYLYVLKKKVKDKKGKEVVLERVCLLTGNPDKLIWLDAVYPEVMKGQIYRDLYESMVSVQF